MLETSTFLELTRRVADVIATDGGELLGVGIAEMGDGSGRYFAHVDTYQAGLEQRYRVTTPSLANAPAWARGRDWEVAVRVGDSWMQLLDESVA